MVSKSLPILFLFDGNFLIYSCILFSATFVNAQHTYSDYGNLHKAFGGKGRGRGVCGMAGPCVQRRGVGGARGRRRHRQAVAVGQRHDGGRPQDHNQLRGVV